MSDPRNRGDQQSSNRVRKDGADYDRTTGNLIYAWFIHREARPVDGISDCQWHVHCIVVNATFDEQEKLFRPSKRPSAMSITQTKMAQS
ncbi:MAG TPA: relaxase domain-containing protein, partial [Chthoniobacterales bacterium]